MSPISSIDAVLIVESRVFSGMAGATQFRYQAGMRDLGKRPVLTASVRIEEFAGEARAVKAAGFDAVEVEIDGLAGQSPGFDELIPQAAALPIDIAVVSMGEVEISPTLEIPESSDHFVQTITHGLQLAAKAGASVLRLPMRKPPTTPYMDALAIALELLLQVRFEAEDHGVTIAIDTAWRRFLLTPWEAVEFLDRVNSPNVGFTLDVGAAQAIDEPVDWIRTLGRRLACMRGCDFHDDRQAPEQRDVTGERAIDWTAVATALRNIEYSGPVLVGGEDLEAERRRVARLLDMHEGTNSTNAI